MVCTVAMGCLEQHLLFSDELCGLKHAVMLQRCCVFKAGWDLHLHVLFQRNLLPSFPLPTPASSSVTSTILAGRCCNYRLPQRPTQGSLLSSHGWFTVLIFRSHRSWPWGRTVVVTTTSWPTLWVIIRRLPRGGAGPALFCMWRDSAITSHLHAPSGLPAFVINRTRLYHCIFFPLYIIFLLCVFINQNVAGRLNCVFPHK